MAQFVGFMTVLLIVFGSPSMGMADYGPECMDVARDFGWCTAYLEGIYDEPYDACCEGLKKLNGMAKQEGPKRICRCIEGMANEVDPPYITSRIDALYVMCHIHLSFPISERMDCSKAK